MHDRRICAYCRAKASPESEAVRSFAADCGAASSDELSGPPLDPALQAGDLFRVGAPQPIPCRMQALFAPMAAAVFAAKALFQVTRASADADRTFVAGNT